MDAVDQEVVEVGQATAESLLMCLCFIHKRGAFAAVQAAGDECLLVFGRPARPSSNMNAGYLHPPALPECELTGSSPIRLSRGRVVDISASSFRGPAGLVPFAALASGMENLFFEVKLSAGLPS